MPFKKQYREESVKIGIKTSLSGVKSKMLGSSKNRNMLLIAVLLPYNNSEQKYKGIRDKTDIKVTIKPEIIALSF